MENVLFRKKINYKIKKIYISNFIIYFAFYSFLGFCFESIFGIFTKGVLESRQSFLFGPFCAIYGIGAILMIYILKPFEKNTFAIFAGSALIGAISEYLMSYICELYFHFKWWDYRDFFLNLNGRTCLFFIVIWGFLGVLLIKYVNPKLNFFITKIKTKYPRNVFNFAIFGLALFLIIDIFITSFALKYFYAKISFDYDLQKTNYSAEQLYSLSYIKILDKNYLLKIFPNIRIAGNEMDNVFVDSLYDIENTYYLKIFNNNSYK